MLRFRTLLSILAVVVWVLAALPEALTLQRPNGRETPEQVASFERRFEREIIPSYRTLGVTGSFESQGFEPDDSTPVRHLHYRVYRRTHFSPTSPEKGAIVISPDRGELETQY